MVRAKAVRIERPFHFIFENNNLQPNNFLAKKLIIHLTFQKENSGRKLLSRNNYFIHIS